MVSSRRQEGWWVAAAIGMTGATTPIMDEGGDEKTDKPMPTLDHGGSENRRR